MKKPIQLRPQDVLILLKLVVQKKKDQRISDIAQQIGISASEVSQGIERLKAARLLHPNKREPIRANVNDFLLFGVPYVFPAVIGSLTRGVPTAHSSKPLSEHVVSSEKEQYVWPHADGSARGQAVSPLYSSVPVAAKNDPELHELLALLDAVRIGRAREQKFAANELKRRLQLAMPDNV